MAGARSRSSPDFGPLAAGYDRFRPIDENWWRLFDVLVSEGDLAGRRVVDVGCGTGRLAAALGERGSRVWGVDPSEEMLARAREHARGLVRFKQGRAEALPFKDGWFERAVLRLVVHLIDRPRAFAELDRVLADGDGAVVVASYAPDSFERFWVARVVPEVVEIDAARFPSAQTLVRELAQAGFPRTRVRTRTQTRRLSRGDALERIRGRFISTLRLVDEAALAAGLERAERELPEQIEDRRRWLVVTAARAGVST